MGDLNLYAKEDPISALKEAGCKDLVRRFEGKDAYSYVFDGQWGYLDHALASPHLARQVTGTTTWHINADEPTALDYNTEFKSPAQVEAPPRAPTPYRSSDHDPVLVGLDLAPSKAGAEAHASLSCFQARESTDQGGSPSSCVESTSGCPDLPAGAPARVARNNW